MKLTHRLINLMQIPYNKLSKKMNDLLWTIFSISDSKIALTTRCMYLNKYARFLGNNIYIGKYVCIKNINRLSIGENVSIHSFSYIDAFGDIDIGNNVSIANHCTLISSDHTWEDSLKSIKCNKVAPKQIVIEDDVWIVAGVRVLGGTTISRRNVIGAGAVLKKYTTK